MPRVYFTPSNRSADVKPGASLYDAALQAGLPVASSCAAEFTCGKCNMKVLSGEQGLSKQTEKERNLLRRENRPETDRISCCTAVWGNCTVTTSYW